jgi:mRNA-degrading endonuclease RelE of RelBE toxin-antitoxin system
MAAFTIDYTHDAVRQIGDLRAHEQGTVLDAIDDQLQHQPTVETRHRKRLRPNIVAGWQLSVGDIRVLYDVQEDHQVVTVFVVGRKQGNRLIVDGEEIQL